nr:unnamed protein product [Digitaria exilis]
MDSTYAMLAETAEKVMRAETAMFLMNRQIGRLEERLYQSEARRVHAEKEATTELARAKKLRIQLEEKKRIIRARDALEDKEAQLWEEGARAANAEDMIVELEEGLKRKRLCTEHPGSSSEVGHKAFKCPKKKLRKMQESVEKPAPSHSTDLIMGQIKQKPNLSPTTTLECVQKDVEEIQPSPLKRKQPSVAAEEPQDEGVDVSYRQHLLPHELEVVPGLPRHRLNPSQAMVIRVTRTKRKWMRRSRQNQPRTKGTCLPPEQQPQAQPPPALNLADVLDRQTRVMKRMTDVVVALQGNQGHRQPQGDDVQKKIERFIRLRAPTFDYSPEPMEAEDWLRVMETKLDLTDCNDEECVAIAAHQMTGSAKAWWESYCNTHRNPVAITWDEFCKAFKEHHIPKQYRHDEVDRDATPHDPRKRSAPTRCCNQEEAGRPKP